MSNLLETSPIRFCEFGYFCAICQKPLKTEKAAARHLHVDHADYEGTLVRGHDEKKKKPIIDQYLDELKKQRVPVRVAKYTKQENGYRCPHCSWIYENNKKASDHRRSKCFDNDPKGRMIPIAYRVCNCYYPVELPGPIPAAIGLAKTSRPAIPSGMSPAMEAAVEPLIQGELPTREIVPTIDLPADSTEVEMAVAAPQIENEFPSVENFPTFDLPATETNGHSNDPELTTVTDTPFVFANTTKVDHLSSVLDHTATGVPNEILPQSTVKRLLAKYLHPDDDVSVWSRHLRGLVCTIDHQQMVDSFVEILLGWRLSPIDENEVDAVYMNYLVQLGMEWRSSSSHELAYALPSQYLYLLGYTDRHPCYETLRKKRCIDIPETFAPVTNANDDLQQLIRFSWRHQLGVELDSFRSWFRKSVDAGMPLHKMHELYTFPKFLGRIFFQKPKSARDQALVGVHFCLSYCVAYGTDGDVPPGASDNTPSIRIQPSVWIADKTIRYLHFFRSAVTGLILSLDSSADWEDQANHLVSLTRNGAVASFMHEIMLDTRYWGQLELSEVVLPAATLQQADLPSIPVGTTADTRTTIDNPAVVTLVPPPVGPTAMEHQTLHHVSREELHVPDQVTLEDLHVPDQVTLEDLKVKADRFMSRLRQRCIICGSVTCDGEIIKTGKGDADHGKQCKCVQWYCFTCGRPWTPIGFQVHEEYPHEDRHDVPLTIGVFDHSDGKTKTTCLSAKLLNQRFRGSNEYCFDCWDRFDRTEPPARRHPHSCYLIKKRLRAFIITYFGQTAQADLSGLEEFTGYYVTNILHKDERSFYEELSKFEDYVTCQRLLPKKATRERQWFYNQKNFHSMSWDNSNCNWKTGPTTQAKRKHSDAFEDKRTAERRSNGIGRSGGVSDLPPAGLPPAFYSAGNRVDHGPNPNFRYDQGNYADNRYDKGDHRRQENKFNGGNRNNYR